MYIITKRTCNNDFDLCYYYIILKWEKPINNSRVLIDVVVNHQCLVFEDKYYLANARYCNSDYFMILY